MITSRRRWLLDVPVFAAVLAAIVWNSDPKAIWSPYYYITVNRLETPGTSESPPQPEALTQRDPPVYLVRVNQFGYHFDAALDSRRYTPGTQAAKSIRWLELQYGLPYVVAGAHDRILVVGAGGGFDVEAALASGAKHIDAVEIDPAIIRISRRFNAGAPYSDPRVTVHIDDARSYFAKAKPGYDMVVFGFLDSQALFSTMNNVRLDGYVYTVESIRSAYALLNDKGLLALSFALGNRLQRREDQAVVRGASAGERKAWHGEGAENIRIGPQNLLRLLRHVRCVAERRARRRLHHHDEVILIFLRHQARGHVLVHVSRGAEAHEK